MMATELVERYREAVIRYGHAIDAGKSKAANKAFDEAIRLSHHFRRGGPEMQRALMALFEDKNVWIRYESATHSLEFAPAEAVPVLREIAAGPPGPVRLLAETTLEQWEAGTLQLP